MGLFDWIRRGLQEIRLGKRSSARFSLEDGVLIVARSSSRHQTIRLADLDEIGIETNDMGPFAEDVFWRLRAGPTTVLVPQQSPMFQELMNLFGEREGFDWQPFLESMGCTDCHYFPCWTRP